MDNQPKALLVASIRNRMFASRDTVDEALNYAVEIIERLYNDDRAAVYTALHVVMNTIADKITALPDQLPEPPAEIRIAHADLPDTGAQLLDDRITDIVDQRLARLDIQNTVEKAIDKYGLNVQHRIEKAIEEYDYEDIITNMVRNMNFTIDVE